MTPPAPSLAIGSYSPLAPLPPTDNSLTDAPSNSNNDFLNVINKVMNGNRDSSDDSSSRQDDEKPAKPDANASPDANTAGMLLALLAPPLPELPKLPAQKTSAHGPAPVETDAKEATQPPAGGATTETKPAAALTGENALLAAEAESAKDATGKPVPPSGTPAAITSQRMNLSSERNEIAGSVEQKLPHKAVTAISSTDSDASSADSGTKLPMPFEWREASSEPLPIVDVTAASFAAPSVSASAPAAAVEAAAPVSSAATVERLEQMISREAVAVRQSGAHNLGVTLSLDSNTQLFLQLTTHNGLTQASVRLERGQFSPEGGQWAQLQQSLARQNVELLPMSGGSNLSFQQNTDGRSRNFATRQDSEAEMPNAVEPVPQRQQKQQNSPRKTWELWA